MSNIATALQSESAAVGARFETVSIGTLHQHRTSGGFLYSKIFPGCHDSTLFGICFGHHPIANFIWIHGLPLLFNKELLFVLCKSHMFDGDTFLFLNFLQTRNKSILDNYTPPKVFEIYGIQLVMLQIKWFVKCKRSTCSLLINLF